MDIISQKTRKQIANIEYKSTDGGWKDVNEESIIYYHKKYKLSEDTDPQANGLLVFRISEEQFNNRESLKADNYIHSVVQIEYTRDHKWADKANTFSRYFIVMHFEEVKFNATYKQVANRSTAFNSIMKKAFDNHVAPNLLESETIMRTHYSLTEKLVEYINRYRVFVMGRMNVVPIDMLEMRELNSIESNYLNSIGGTKLKKHVEKTGAFEAFKRVLSTQIGAKDTLDMIEKVIRKKAKHTTVPNVYSLPCFSNKDADHDCVYDKSREIIFCAQCTGGPKPLHFWLDYLYQFKCNKQVSGVADYEKAKAFLINSYALDDQMEIVYKDRASYMTIKSKGGTETLPYTDEEGKYQLIADLLRKVNIIKMDSCTSDIYYKFTKGVHEYDFYYRECRLWVVDKLSRLETEKEDIIIRHLVAFLKQNIIGERYRAREMVIRFLYEEAKGNSENLIANYIGILKDKISYSEAETYFLEFLSYFHTWEGYTEAMLRYQLTSMYTAIVHNALLSACDKKDAAILPDKVITLRSKGISIMPRHPLINIMCEKGSFFESLQPAFLPKALMSYGQFDKKLSTAIAKQVALVTITQNAPREYIKEHLSAHNVTNHTIQKESIIMGKQKLPKRNVLINFTDNIFKYSNPELNYNHYVMLLRKELKEEKVVNAARDKLFMYGYYKWLDKYEVYGNDLMCSSVVYSPKIIQNIKVDSINNSVLEHLFEACNKKEYVETKKTMGLMWRSRYAMLKDWHEKGMPLDFTFCFTYSDLKRMISPEVTRNTYFKQCKQFKGFTALWRTRLYPGEPYDYVTHMFVKVNSALINYVYYYYKQLQAELVFREPTTEEDPPSGSEKKDGEA